MDHCEKRKRKQNPRETANIFSLLTFAYTASLFKKAYKNHDLEENDLYDVLKACCSKKCGDKIEKKWKIENEKETPPSIYRLMWATFGWRYILRGVIHLCWKVFNSIVEPWAFSRLISYFKPGQTTMTKTEAYYYAALVLVIHLVYVVYIHNYVIWMYQLGLEIKTSFSSLLYRKALKLSPASISEITLGNIVTLITRDVHAFEQSIWFINETWIGSIQTCFICYLLYAKLGVVSFIGIGILLSVLPLQVFIGNYVSKLRLATGKKTDERLQVIQEILSTIRIIKMYNWEEHFTEKINDARLKEINKMLLGVYLKFIIVVLGVLFSKLGFYLLIMSYIWMGYTAEAELVFYVLTIFKDLKHTLGVLIPFGIGRGADLYSAIIRINKVIQCEELDKKIGSDEPTSKPFVELTEATVRIKETTILKDISFRTTSGLTLVTGTVGSGKTSLLKCILQEYTLSEGSIETAGRISYASQDPWLFPSSIRQNILFGEKFNEKRYAEVVRVCALEYDFSLFDKGDETIITDKGANLSRGQQARVNLARAIYKESEIYLLDDSLTALDTHVQDYIFNECIKNHLKNKICILVTQTASHIEEADNIVIMADAQIKYQGRPNKNVLEKISELIIEDDDLEKEVIQENHQLQNGHALETEQQMTKKQIYSEVNIKGEVDFAVYKKYFIFGGGFLLMFCNIFLFGIAQGTESYSDKLLTQWVDEQQTVLDLRRNFTENGLAFADNDFNNTTNISIILEESVSAEQHTIKLYSIMIVVSTVFALIKTYAIFDFCRRASINIHKAMVRSIIFAVMSFFDTHFIGNILNRFSQDLLNIDEHLLHILSECVKVTFSVIGIVVLITIINKYFLIFSLIFLLILIFLRKLYLPTGRSLKRLEAATRSPMIGHLNASLEGLTTIRAYKAQNILIEEFDRYQDVYTSAHYTSMCSMRAFGFVMDFLCSIFIILVVSRFLFIDTDSSAGDVGLVLSQIFMLAGTVQWGVRTWAYLENLMTSVERVLEYTEIPSENLDGPEVKNWPSKGAISYRNVSLTYNNVETVLKNLNFEVEPQQKIGIVGRTGAGKSSIISSIFRLYDVKGDIVVDNVNITTLSIKFLRRKLAIIPQEPVLFSGTVRSNLDPYQEFEDTDLWNVLEQVNIKDYIPSLNLIVSSSGSGFSSGQKQLICLARAILRKSKVVILDEASANMDPETDALLHETIRKNFSGCTVISIAHRLHSVLECDKVMVLNRGEINEFDDPIRLLQNKEGMFYKMVSQAGLLAKQKQ
nr:probable multidrug resistance-associated protein lethal(2)03659 [Leptinotarsa decemlineata]XP_023012688.1 probable multidrug resistance-associated protein lethal(2)03659 [Leptinotarsa decemlineata]XP_023012689.1 probable multidrug resistance-associated protein lethal(2)03659 [Leptinotarsa decemlineata]XP_023012690.1 probable multidrug resistance-associated protein lethal(2)03659 [Leptinotarsa decemlineata]